MQVNEKEYTIQDALGLLKEYTVSVGIERICRGREHGCRGCFPYLPIRNLWLDFDLTAPGVVVATNDALRLLHKRGFVLKKLRESYSSLNNCISAELWVSLGSLRIRWGPKVDEVTALPLKFCTGPIIYYIAQ